MALSGGCAEPSIAARAVWVDAEIAADGTRTLHSYARGLTTDYAIRNPAGRASDDDLVLELSPSGEGALVRSLPAGAFEQLGSDGKARVTYVDFEGGRGLPLDIQVSHTSEQTLGFGRAGDLLFWLSQAPAAVSMVPLAGGVTTGADGAIAPMTHELTSLASDIDAVDASDAPIMFVVELGEGSSAIASGSVVQALSLRSSDGTWRFEELGRASFDPSMTIERQGGVVCTGRARRCGLARVDPDGHGITVRNLAPNPCRYQRWSWAVDPNAADASPPAAASCVIDGNAPEEVLEGTVVAAISPSHYVVTGPSGLSVYNWQTGDLSTRPWITSERDWSLHRVSGGRGVVAVSSKGPMVRATTAGIEVVSVTQISCDFPQTPLVSPRGLWASWVCDIPPGPIPDAENTTAGTLVRVSSTGLEQHQGVPMWIAAIDDTGSTLMWSRADMRVLPDIGLPPVSPRNLYILGSAGDLARAQSLEPDPVLSHRLDIDARHWIAAQARLQ